MSDFQYEEYFNNDSISVNEFITATPEIAESLALRAMERISAVRNYIVSIMPEGFSALIGPKTNEIQDLIHIIDPQQVKHINDLNQANMLLVLTEKRIRATESWLHLVQLRAKIYRYAEEYSNTSLFTEDVKAKLNTALEIINTGGVFMNHSLFIYELYSRFSEYYAEADEDFRSKNLVRDDEFDTYENRPQGMLLKYRALYAVIEKRCQQLQNQNLDRRLQNQEPAQSKKPKRRWPWGNES